MTDAPPQPGPVIRPMTLADHDDVMNLMAQTPGVTLRDADSREATARYLERNPGLSFVATASGSIVGCVLSGHDGRRGYLQHLVVHPAWRHQGIGTSLVTHCLTGLERLGIFKSHVDVLHTNAPAQKFWEGLGWQLRTDIRRYSFVHGGRDNA